MENNLVSIITITFNAEEYLEKTILSVLNQTYKNVEYIIIDGGSTDKTIDIIKKYEDKITYWISEKDSGIYDAMNKGIIVSNGEWLNFLNGGDSYYNNTVLEDIFNKNKVEQYDLIYGDCYFVGRNDKLLRVFKAEKLTKESIKKGMIVSHQSIFSKKRKTPLFDLKYKYKAEWNWLIEILYREDVNNLLYVDFSIVYYKLGGFSYQGFEKDFNEFLNILYLRFGVFSILRYSLHIARIWVGHYVRKFLGVDTLRLSKDGNNVE